MAQSAAASLFAEGPVRACVTDVRPAAGKTTPPAKELLCLLDEIGTDGVLRRQRAAARI